MDDTVRKSRLLFWQKMRGVIDQETFDAEIKDLMDGQLTLSLTPALEECVESSE